MRLFCFVMALLAFGCTHATPPSTPQNSERIYPCRPPTPIPEAILPTIARDDSVTLRRGGCFGSCPIYSVTLKGDGSVTAIGEKFVAKEGPQDWKIDPLVARRVLSQFSRIDVFSLEPTSLLAITDLPSAWLVVKIGERQVELEHYGAGAEFELSIRGRRSWRLQANIRDETRNPSNAVLTHLERMVDDATQAEQRVVGCLAGK